MAVWSPSLGIGSCCLLKNGITEAWRFPSAYFSMCKNKTRRGSETLRVARKHISGDLVTNALQSYHRLSKIRASTGLKEEVSTRRAQADDLKKVTTTSYSFRTKSGALVKVKVEKKREEKYSIMVYVSSLELSGDDDDKSKSSSLVMVWGVYRSDSSCFLPLDFETSSQDSVTHTTETPFVKSSLSDELMLGLEFDGLESPFYLSFRLKNDPNGLEMLTHRDTNFCVPVGFTAGHPLPLGLSSGQDDASWNFAFFSRSSKSVVLCLYDDTTNDKPALELDLDPYVNRTGDVWHASVEKTWEFVRYGYRCKESTHSQEEVEAEDIVLDPYATVIEKSTSQKFLGSLFKNPPFDWGRDVSPNIPLEKLIVYRLNVKSFTQHKSSKLPTNIAGTFIGIAEKVNHLKTLGTNAVLLEPVFSFSEQSGPYFPFHFFSPMDMHGAVNSMKEMVKRLHSEGIEVLLEVVFTHTAESGSLRGIDDSSYYYKGRSNDLDSKSHLNCNFPVVQQLVLESLRYWVTEFHVDGFCFINASSLLRGVHGEHLSRPPLVEAISFDPLLAGRKLIADCWNPHDMVILPKEVRFPHWKRWGELNSRYCRDVRNFVRGRGLLSDLATRICGSGDVFTDGRGPAFSFNYVSRNSGLSLVDLVSFSGGTDLASELSWNCGEEGATNKSTVLQTRLKQIRNFLFIQYVSLGVPVLNMGDECGVSTKGSPLLESRKLFDWNMLASAFGVQITQFISFMASVRTRRSDVFQRRNFLKPENIVWYANDQTTPKWEDPGSKFLALEIKAETEEETMSLVEPTEPKNNDLFIGFNASDQPENVILPSLPVGRKWRRLVDTALPFPGFFSIEGETVVAEEEGEEMNQPVVYEMKPYSCTLFETINATA
ncbi:Isoamylase 2 [Hirschfeldia incana]|nr:Isoamylase 2 [Hirschfeldia incana]